MAVVHITLPKQGCQPQRDHNLREIASAAAIGPADATISGRSKRAGNPTRNQRSIAGLLVIYGKRFHAEHPFRRLREQVQAQL
jgi:hypothetical protein